MPQLLIIKAETAKDGVQYIGDVVGVFSDDHIFSDHELAMFNVLEVGTGINTVADVKARLRQIQPRVEIAYLHADGKYYWTRPDPGLESIDVFQIEGSNRWYRLEEEFKYPVTVEDLSAEEKQLIETLDINHPSVDSFIRKLAKDVAMLPGNDVEIKELRNTSPDG